MALSATAPVFIEHFNGHRVVESPDHLDGTFGFETHELRGAEERERRRGSAQLFAGANEEQHRVATLLVVDKVLSRVARLACLPLSFPVQKLTADGVVLIHRAR